MSTSGRIGYDRSVTAAALIVLNNGFFDAPQDNKTTYPYTLNRHLTR